MSAQAGEDDVRRALLSVTDKTGIVDFARGLGERDFELVSTGGTARVLREAGLAVTDVSELTGTPEMMDGRVKTLHPAIHGGLLALRDDAGHVQALQRHDIGRIDVLAVNLYAFRQTVACPDVTDEQATESIDIGGPSMIRSAAKNHRWVWVASGPSDYAGVLEGLDAERDDLQAGRVARRRLAGAAFRATAAYDAAIGAWFARHDDEVSADLVLEAGAGRALRYGENPAQRAAFYVRAGCNEPSVARAEQLSGKALSYNNIMDADAALELVKDFERPAVAVIKHANPCGCGVGDDLGQAFERAWSGDPKSAFGGILSLNRPVDAALADAIARPDRFLEVIVAPSFDAEALTLLTTRCKWGQNVRLLACGALDGERDGSDPAVRKVTGGYLVQDRDLGFAGEKREVVSQRAPHPAEMEDLEFAWRVCKHVKSNAILLAAQGAVVGVGAGQMSRVDSVFLAGHKAGERARGAVLASDAFFPFRDSVDQAAALGVTALIQPGGSRRDAESIAAADEHDLAMLFTGARHFRH